MSKNFTHLHVHTEYSLLDGASKLSELIAYAKELGMTSLAITDHGVMYGAVDFYQQATKQGIKPIIGCEVYLASGNCRDRNSRGQYHLILLAENETGYHNLMKIVSTGQLEGFYYKPRVDKDVLRQYAEGIICLSACIQGEVPVLIRNRDMEGARRCVEEYIEIFGKDNYFLEMQNHGLPEEAVTNAGLKVLAQEYGLGLVATNDLHYVRKEDAEAQDVLLCIQTTSTVDDPDRLRFPCDDFYLKSYDEMAALFPDCPEALENTNRIAERCNVKLEFGHLLLPEFPVPEGYDEKSYLLYLCDEGIKRCYQNADSELMAKVHERLDYELGIITQMGYVCYFLIVWDFINYARKHDIPVGPGRGSAAGSVVAYLLGITNIDPLKYDLLFERFLNPERVSMPDIDTDFCYLRRSEVLMYVLNRYGTDRVAQIVTYGTLQARAAVRDVGKALGMTYAATDEIARMIPRDLGITLKKAMAGNRDLKDAYETRPEVKRLIDLAMSVEGLPRNVGTHAAGVIIAPKDLRDYVPLQYGGVEIEDGHGGSIPLSITQYDKNKVEELGLLKMDFLGLRNLTIIADAIKFIEETTGVHVDIDHIPLADAKTSAMLCRGDTFGVFQLESAGITKLLKELAPERFEDLIPLVALYRPGPLGTGMAEDFIQGRHGKRTAKVLHPLVEPILADTYGVILYQEQVMQITSALAGFSLGQADILRRAMGKKKAKELDSMRQDFVDGAKKYHDIPESKSEEIFALLQHFAGYGFNKSHSVAYALVAYQTAYLKANWPVQYMAAYLNSVIADGDKLSWYINICRNEGMKILPPDVNESGEAFGVDADGCIRFGLGGVKSVGDNAVAAIIKERRANGPFKDLVDFCKRVSMRAVNRRVLENLVKCGAMDDFGAKRSQMLCVLDSVMEFASAYQKDKASGQIGLFGDEMGFDETCHIVYPDMPEMQKRDVLACEKELIGFYVTGHPLDEYRQVLRSFMPIRQFMGESSIPDGRFVKVAGIISSCVMKTTKRGEPMALLTLEDFSGRIQVVVFPKAYRTGLKYIYEEGIVAVEGSFSVDETESKIMASRINPLPKPGREVHIKIEAQLENPLIQRELANIMKRYHGGDMVYLHLMGSRKVIRTTENFWVDGNSNEFREEIRKLLGDGCIK